MIIKSLYIIFLFFKLFSLLSLVSKGEIPSPQGPHLSDRQIDGGCKSL